jgi:UDP:flavonoid glycosyltransferase YjiC (YdhE family)
VRALVGTSGYPGHALPALALTRALRERDHDVVVATAPRWSEAVEGLGARTLDGGDLGIPAGMAEAPLDGVADMARALTAIVVDAAPDVVVVDVLAPAMALAAERAGVARATLMPVPYPGAAEGAPPDELGLLPPRTPVGGMLWRMTDRWIRRALPGSRWLGRGPRGLDALRGQLGLQPIGRDDGPVTDGPTLVASLPQLEQPRRWPPDVHVTGALVFDPAAEPTELPPGDAPLVFIAASTERDPELRLVRTAVEALAGEPLRVVASTGGRATLDAGELPANAVVVDWAPYSQLMADAALVVSQGGQGTLVRALAEGVPVLVCPDAVDMAGNGVRVVRARAGEMLPRRLLAAATLRAAVRRVLADPLPAATAREIAAWARANPGDARAADLVEAHAGAGAAP